MRRSRPYYNGVNGYTVSRSGFLQAVIGASTALSLPLPVRTERLSHALVLSGGGARGAYEAGIITALASQNGVTDGSPLKPYGFVCGTSIGALNGWMVATGQYARLRELWNTISSQRILRIKPQFSAIRDVNSGIATRISQGLGLLTGLRTDVSGIFQNEPVTAWLKANVDVRQQVLVPFFWTATNLSTQRTEYFYRVPYAVAEERKRALLAAFRMTIGPAAVLREAKDEYLHLALFASAAIPIVFDPVELPSADGTGVHQYVDGGIASNTPIGLARTVARNVQVVLLDPPFESDTYHNAVEVGFGAYATMQRRLLENDIRSTFFQSVGKQDVDALTASVSGANLSQEAIAALRSYFEQARDTQLSYIRPSQTLPLSVGAFNDDAHIKEAMNLGEVHGRTGFTPYTLADFLSSSA